MYEHEIQPLSVGEFPKLSNNSDIDKVIEFLGSAENVITNTYHGVYWATLLRKKVIAVPLRESSRFFFFKHPPRLVSKPDTNFSLAQSYDCLEECRQVNLDFYRDLCQI